jgi:hypothetical protein
MRYVHAAMPPAIASPAIAMAARFSARLIAGLSPRCTLLAFPFA